MLARAELEARKTALEARKKMSRCQSCDAEIQVASRFCPSCGAAAAVAGPPDMETIAMETAAIETVAMDAAPPSPGAGNGRATAVPAQKQRFAPGALIASRYRIISR